MSRVSNEILHNAFHWRYACKKFDPNLKIREADWNILLESLRLSASSYGLQPWRFIVVQNPELRQQLLKLSWGQSPVVEASHFIVFTFKEKLDEQHIDRHVINTAEVREIPVESLAKYKKVMVDDMIIGPRHQTIRWWAQRQTYIAMGSLLTTAALMQIDTLPMEGLDPEGYDRVLGLEGSGFKTVAAVACGYRAVDDKYQNIKKIRFDLSDVVEYK